MGNNSETFEVAVDLRARVLKDPRSEIAGYLHTEESACRLSAASY